MRCALELFGVPPDKGDDLIAELSKRASAPPSGVERLKLLVIVKLILSLLYFYNI